MRLGGLQVVGALPVVQVRGDAPRRARVVEERAQQPRAAAALRAPQPHQALRAHHRRVSTQTPFSVTACNLRKVESTNCCDCLFVTWSACLLLNRYRAPYWPVRLVVPNASTGYKPVMQIQYCGTEGGLQERLSVSSRVQCQAEHGAQAGADHPAAWQQRA